MIKSSIEKLWYHGSMDLEDRTVWPMLKVLHFIEEVSSLESQSLF